MELLTREISCPYCGETIDILIDDSVDDQDYYEDCSVCCRAIRVQLQVGFEGMSEVTILRDDE